MQYERYLMNHDIAKFMVLLSTVVSALIFPSGNFHYFFSFVPSILIV
jgi:hypothetical protein